MDRITTSRSRGSYDNALSPPRQALFCFSGDLLVKYREIIWICPRIVALRSLGRALTARVDG